MAPITIEEFPPAFPKPVPVTATPPAPTVTAMFWDADRPLINKTPIAPPHPAAAAEVVPAAPAPPPTTSNSKFVPDVVVEGVVNVPVLVKTCAPFGRYYSFYIRKT